MRHEAQQRDKIHATIEVVVAGAGQTGLSPTVVLKRVTDGFYWNAVGVVFAAPVVTNAVPEVDATDQAGLYRMDIPSSALDMVLGADGYEYKIIEATNSVYQNVTIEPRDEVSEVVLAGVVVATSTSILASELVQTGTTKSVYLAVQTVPVLSGLAGAFVANEITLKMGTSGTVVDLLTALGTDPLDDLIELAKTDGNTAATTGVPTFSAGGGPSGEDIYIITVDDSSPFTIGEYARASGKGPGAGHVHKILALPSGLLMHLHASSTAFDIINGNTVEGVVPSGIYAGFINVAVDTYFSAADAKAELSVVASGVITGNAPKFATAQQLSWVRNLDLDLAGRTFKVG